MKTKLNRERDNQASRKWWIKEKIRKSSSQSHYLFWTDWHYEARRELGRKGKYLVLLPLIVGSQSTQSLAQDVWSQSPAGSLLHSGALTFASHFAQLLLTVSLHSAHYCHCMLTFIYRPHPRSPSVRSTHWYYEPSHQNDFEQKFSVEKWIFFFL